MKVHLQGRDLMEALRRCAPFTFSSDHVRLLAAEGRITLMANDGDVMVETLVPGGIERPGACTFPCNPVEVTLDKLAWDFGTIEAEGDVVSFAFGGFRCSTHGSDPDDFPTTINRPAPAEDAPITFAMGGGPLHDMISAVQDGMGDDTMRVYLAGICLHEVEGRLRAVATNGHTLAFIDGDLPPGAAGMGRWIIPRPVVAFLRQHAAGTITVCHQNGVIRFTMPDGIALTANLINQTYPDYTKVVPAERPTEEAGRMVIDAPMSLAGLMTDLMAGYDETMRAAAIELDEAGLLLRVDGHDGLVNHCVQRVPRSMACWEGPPPPRNAYYQLRYLRSMFRAAHYSPGRCIFQPGGEEYTAGLLRRGNVTGVIMPMKRRDA